MRAVDLTTKEGRFLAHVPGVVRVDVESFGHCAYLMGPDEHFIIGINCDLVNHDFPMPKDPGPPVAMADFFPEAA